MCLLETTSVITSFGSILLTGFVAALSSFALMTLGKKNDFKYDFRKYILTKRMDVYQQVEKMLFDLHLKEYENIKGVQKREFAYFSDRPIDIGTNELAEIVSPILKNGFWLSEMLAQEFQALQNVLFKISFTIHSGHYEQSDYDMHNLDTVDPENFEILQQILFSVNSLYFKDIIHLDEVPSFIKTKRK